MTQRLCMTQRRQGIGGFPGLRQGDYQGLRVRDALTIAVFAGNFGTARQTDQRLNPIGSN